jgi:hypothetical protein
MTVQQLIDELEAMPRDAVVSIAMFNTSGDGLGEASVSCVRDDTAEFECVTIAVEV